MLFLKPDVVIFPCSSFVSDAALKHPELCLAYNSRLKSITEGSQLTVDSSQEQGKMNTPMLPAACLAASAQLVFFILTQFKAQLMK